MGGVVGCWPEAGRWPWCWGNFSRRGKESGRGVLGKNGCGGSYSLLHPYPQAGPPGLPVLGGPYVRQWAGHEEARAGEARTGRQGLWISSCAGEALTQRATAHAQRGVGHWLEESEAWLPSGTR